MSKRVSIIFEDEQHATLKQIAEEERRSFQNQVLHAVDFYIKRYIMERNGRTTSENVEKKGDSQEHRVAQ